jgi:hypothetical protein
MKYQSINSTSTITIISCLVLFFSQYSIAQNVSSSDLNGDSCIDRDDYNLLMTHIRIRSAYDMVYDLNGDGGVNRADARTMVSLFTNPRGEQCPDDPTTLAIGDSYQGGIIFWLDASGEHGLIAAAADQSSGVRWYAGTDGITRATGDGLYAGEANTAIIIAAQVAIGDDGSDYAAQICNDLQIIQGAVTYGDWYLPSKYELNLLYLQKTVVGGFANNFYWSSTEFDNYAAWDQLFAIGNQSGNYKNYGYGYVRAVRAF